MAYREHCAVVATLLHSVHPVAQNVHSDTVHNVYIWSPKRSNAHIMHGIAKKIMLCAHLCQNMFKLSGLLAERIVRMVRRPDYDPGMDVVELTSASRTALAITHS